MIKAERIPNGTNTLSEGDVTEIKARISQIDARLNDMYFQNGQDINAGGLGDGNDAEIAKLTGERAELYNKQGLMSPEEAQTERKRTIDLLISRHLSKTQRVSYSGSLEGEE